MPRDAIPALPPVPADVSPGQRQFMQAVKDALSVRAGQTKNRLDYSPTVRELIQAGVVTVRGGLSGLPGQGPIDLTPPTDGNPWDDGAVPPAPTGVTVLASPWRHYIRWDLPLAGARLIISHTEIWKSIDDGNGDPINDRDQAVQVGTGHLVFDYPVEPLENAYYWVRHRSYANVPGLWSHGVNEGLYGESQPDPQSLLDTLTGEITEGELYKDLTDRIDFIDITDGGLVQNLIDEIANRTSGDLGLSGRLDTLEEGTTSLTSFRNNFEASDFGNWQLAGGATLVAETGTVFEGAQSGLAGWSGGSDPSLPTGCIHLVMPEAFTVTYPGLAIDVTIYVTAPGSNSATEFGLAYALSDGTNSGWTKFPVESGWHRQTFTYVVPENSDNLTHYLCLWPDTSNSGKRVIVDVAGTSLSLDLSGISTNANAITALTSRVDINEGDISSHATQLTSLSATVNDPVSGNAALASNVSLNTAQAQTNEDGITALSGRSDSLETIVNDPVNGVVVNAQNISNNQSQISTNESGISANASDITLLNVTVGDNASDINAQGTLISLAEARITTNEADIAVNVTDVTALAARLDTEEGTSGDHAAAIDSITVDVSRIDGETSALATKDTQLQTEIDGNESAVAIHASSIDGIESKYTVKIDNNGHVSGFGLISTPNDGGGVHSEFGVSADRFWIGHPNADTGKEISFIVENGKVVMDDAYIVTGAITNAHIKVGTIETAAIKDAAITTALIEDGAIQNAKIGNTIQSLALDLNNGIGWQINKSGHIKASEFTLYDENGGIFLAAGRGGAQYFNKVDNSLQNFADISNLPDSMDRLAFGSMNTGGFGNFRFYVDGGNDIAIEGDVFYHPDGTKRVWPAEDGSRVELQEGRGYSGGFFVIHTQLTPNTRWSGFDYGSSTSRHFFVATFHPVTNDWKVYEPDGSSVVFTPLTSDCIVATGTYTGGSAIVNSMVGVNANLPQDGATINRFFKQATVPGGAVDNDLWFCEADIA